MNERFNQLRKWLGSLKLTQVHYEANASEHYQVYKEERKQAFTRTEVEKKGQVRIMTATLIEQYAKCIAMCQAIQTKLTPAVVAPANSSATATGADGVRADGGSVNLDEVLALLEESDPAATAPRNTTPQQAIKLAGLQPKSPASGTTPESDLPKERPAPRKRKILFSRWGIPYWYGYPPTENNLSNVSSSKPKAASSQDAANDQLRKFLNNR